MTSLNRVCKLLLGAISLFGLAVPAYAATFVETAHP